MKVDQAKSPTLDEFMRITREEFAFMASFGFREAAPSRTLYQNPFEVHFEKEGWRIVVEGLSYGFAASVSIRSPDGRAASLGHFCPKGFWEANRQNFSRGQQGEIGYWALGLKDFGLPFLRGEWPKFGELLLKQEEWIAANREAWERQEVEKNMERAIQRADIAFKAKRYAEAAAELSKFEASLPPAQIKKLAIARKRNPL
jgi:hypothetical protein